MKQRPYALEKRISRLLLLIAALLLVFTLARVSLRSRQPLLLETVPEAAGAAWLLDLNEATAAELECLPGIGPVLAQSLVERRETAGPFTCAEDVLAVPGIGEATYEKLRPYITF